MKLPNGFGSVSKLSGNRRRPYIVRKSTADGGSTIIGYAATRTEALSLLSQYNANPWNTDHAGITLQGLYELWREQRMPKLGTANQSALSTAYKHCKALHDVQYKQIKAFQMQGCIDGCGRGASTQVAIKNLWTHLDKFALELDIVTRQYSGLLTTATAPPSRDDEGRHKDRSREK